MASRSRQRQINDFSGTPSTARETGWFVARSIARRGMRERAIGLAGSIHSS